MAIEDVDEVVKMFGFRLLGKVGSLGLRWMRYLGACCALEV